MAGGLHSCFRADKKKPTLKNLVVRYHVYFNVKFSLTKVANVFISLLPYIH